jgi:hypothetical protein
VTCSHSLFMFLTVLVKDSILFLFPPSAHLFHGLSCPIFFQAIAAVLVRLLRVLGLGLSNFHTDFISCWFLATGHSGISIAACVVFDFTGCHVILLLGVFVPVSMQELVCGSALSFPQFWSPSQISFICGLCRWNSVLLLIHRIKGSSFSSFLWYFHGGFIFMPARCAVKCPRAYEKCFCPILIVLFRCDFSPYPGSKG